MFAGVELLSAALPISGAWVSALSGHPAKSLTPWHPLNDTTMAFAESDSLWPFVQEWLMDRRGRDQFAIRYGDETEIYWNDHQKALAEEVSPPSATSTDTLGVSNVLLSLIISKLVVSRADSDASVVTAGLQAQLLDGELCAVVAQGRLPGHSAHSRSGRLGRAQLCPPAALYAHRGGAPAQT